MLGQIIVPCIWLKWNKQKIGPQSIVAPDRLLFPALFISSEWVNNKLKRSDRLINLESIRFEKDGFERKNKNCRQHMLEKSDFRIRRHSHACSNFCSKMISSDLIWRVARAFYVRAYFFIFVQLACSVCTVQLNQLSFSLKKIAHVLAEVIHNHHFNKAWK